jgi:raffinose/stachyose/melibiose transport system permease protein
LVEQNPGIEQNIGQEDRRPRSLLPVLLRRSARWCTPYAYLLPASVIYGLFLIWPLIELVRYSFSDWDGVSDRQFVGLENYRELTQDPLFWQAFRHNLAWMLAGVTVPTLVGLLLAILIVRSPLYGRTSFRVIFFLPQILASIVVAVVWQWIYSPHFGALDALLREVGLSSIQQAWLGSTTYALPAVFLAWAWTAYGFSMVIFIAALQGIDEQYFEAAKMDGAKRWKQTRHVLLPFIRRPMAIVIVLNAIAALQVFDLVYLMTNGGPANATLVLAMYLYQNAFEYSRVGYGSAVAVGLGLMIVLASLVFLRLRGVVGDREAVN